MDEFNAAQSIKKICTIIEDRDKTILETDVKIKYYKDAIEAAEREIKELEKARKRIADENEEVDKQLEQLEFIKKSLKECQKIATQSLIHNQTLEKFVAKELDTKRQETKKLDDEFRTLYSDAKINLSKNPLYKDLETARVEFLKVDIKKCDLEVKIRERKQIIAQRAEIQKKRYYNFFIQMAEDYLTEKKMKELQNLKMQELEAIKNLYNLQENAKMRQKLGTPRDRIKNMTKIMFGSQECSTEKPVVNKPEPPQPKMVPQSITEKLNNMFDREDPKQIEAPQNIRIIEEKVLVPAFVAPQFVVPEKRKNRTVDLSKKWQKKIKMSSSKERISSSQQSNKSSQSLSSQQSQLSQKSQENEAYGEFVTPEPSYRNKLIESSTQNTAPVSYAESQHLTLTQTMEKVPTQYKMMENKSGNDESATRPDISQPTLPNIMEQPTPSSSIMKHRSILNIPENKSLNKSLSQQEIAPKISFNEPNKSVRFNLERPKENTGMFMQSMFANPFESFFGRTPAENIENEIIEQENNNSSFNLSMDQTREKSHLGLGFEGATNHSELRSPEYSYTTEGEGEQSFKSPEMAPFGGGGRGGGFFSFGSKTMFPFQ